MRFSFFDSIVQNRATLFLSLVLVIGFYSIAGPTGFATDAQLRGLGFSLKQPANLFVFWLLHFGIFHLAANALALLLAGSVAESRVPSKHVVGVFAFSAAVGAVGFAFFNPGTLLAGASGGVSGVMTAAVMVRPFRAMAVIALSLLAANLLLVPLLDAGVSSSVDRLESEARDLEPALQAARQSGESKKAGEIQALIVSKQSEQRRIESGAQRDLNKKSDWTSHLWGSIAGALYVILFCPRTMEHGVENVRKWKKRLLAGIKK